MLDPLTDYEADRAAIRAGRDRGAAWLLSHQQRNGAFKPDGNTVSTYYKALWALSNAGHIAAGTSTATWIRDHALTANGDFAGPDGRGGQAANATYANAWMILGAQRLGVYDLATPAVKRLLTLRTPDSGFYRVPPNAEVSTGSAEAEDIYVSGSVPGTTDLLSTSMSGLACLATGHHKAARAAGAHIVRMWRAQPELPRQVHFQWHDETGLIVDARGGDPAAFHIDADSTRQRYFQVGIAAAFLAKLHEVTGEDEFLRTARQALDATTSFASDRYATPQSGKVGWGAAYVYRLTGEPKYREIACAVARGLLDLQGRSGAWMEESGDLDRQLEITAEFVALLGEIESATV